MRTDVSADAVVLRVVRWCGRNVVWEETSEYAL